MLVLGVLVPRAGAAARGVSLDEALAMARARRPELAEARAERSQAGLDVLAAGFERARLSLDSHYTEQAQRLYLDAPPELCASIEGLCDGPTRARLYGFTASLTVPLWTGWALEAGWSRARARHRASKARVEAAGQALTLEVTASYWAARRAQLRHEAAERALARRTELATLLGRRSRAGVTPAADALRAQSAVFEVKATVAERAAQRDQARAELAAALQADEGEVIPGDDPPAALPPLVPLATALSDAERARPDLQAAQAELEAQKKDVVASRGPLWPQISLFARADVQNEVLGIPQEHLVGSFAAGVTVRWQIFDSLTTFQAMGRAEAERARRETAYFRARAAVRLEVTAAHARLQAARERRVLMRDAAAATRQALDLLRRRYEGGAALLIEVRDAQEDLDGLETGEIDAAIDLVLAQATLDAARGLGR